jgi:hypothetical protein
MFENVYLLLSKGEAITLFEYRVETTRLGVELGAYSLEEFREKSKKEHLLLKERLREEF